MEPAAASARSARAGRPLRRWAVAAALAGWFGVLGWSLAGVDLRATQRIAGAGNVVLYALAAALCLLRSRRDPAERAGWRLWAAACAAIVLQNVWTVVTAAVSIPTTPAAVVYLAASSTGTALGLAGLWRWPWRTPGRGRRLLDGLGAVFFVGSLVLILSALGTWQAALTQATIPHLILRAISLRLALVGGLGLYLLFQSPRRARGPLGWFVAALLASAPSVALMQTAMTSGLDQGGPRFALISLVPLLLCFGAASRAPVEVPAPDAGQRAPWDALVFVPYLLAGAVLMVGAARDWPLPAGTTGGFVLLTGILVARQYLLLREVRASEALLAARVHERTRSLEESEARFRRLFQEAPVALGFVSREGAVALLNDRFQQVFGYRAEDVPSLEIWYARAYPDEAYRRAAVERWTLAVRAAVERRSGIAPSLYEVTSKDGTVRQVEISGIVLEDGVLSTFVDLTDQRRLEAQLRQSQKLESIGRLAGGMAHDFNNLLTVILGAAEAMNQDLESGAAPGKDDVEQVRVAGQRGRDLTRQLLAFARKQVIAPVALDPNAVVRGSEKLLRRVLGEDVELRVELTPDPWTVRCDPGQLEQLILNLAVNARDAMPGGGTLTLETRNTRVGVEELAHDLELQPGAWVQLLVSDSGVGMSPDVKAHLFEPFFTTKPPGKGTGLGLATVYGIVEQSGGHVRVRSEPGRGATFAIWLPRVDAPPSTPAATPPPSPPRGAATVLVVEDDPLVQRVTARALRAGGYRVLLASGGAEAVDLASREGDGLDLVVTDVVMPRQNGREVVEELRRRRPGLRALFLSGYPQEVISDHGVLDSGIDFLPKPFTPTALLARVRELLDAPPPSGGEA